MNLVVAGYVIAAVMVFAAAVRVASSERVRAIVPQFLTLSCLMIIWLMGTAAMLGAETAASASRWSSAAMIGLCLIPPAFWSFYTVLGDFRERHWLLPYVWLPGLVLAVLSVGTSFFVGEPLDTRWGYYHDVKIGVLLPVMHLFIVGLAAFRGNPRIPRRSEGMRHRHVALAATLGAGFLLDLVPWAGVVFPPSGWLFAAVSWYALDRALRKNPRGRSSLAFASRKILTTIQDAVIVIDLEGRIEIANPAAGELLELPSERLVSMRISEVIESPFNVGPASDTLMNGRSFTDRPMIWRRKGAETVEVSVSGSMLRDDDGFPAGMLYVARTISDSRHAEQIEYQAHHDALTGLPNRLALRRRTAQLLAELPRKSRVAAIIALSVEGFSLVNDSKGQATGDRLIQLVAGRLRRALRGGDVVARVGGDEFSFLVDLRDNEDIEIVVEKLHAAFEAPFVVDGNEIYLGSRLGIACWPDHGRTAVNLLQNAETALRRAKKSERRTHEVYGTEITQEATERMDLERRLRKAVDNGDFILEYQPVMSLGTGEIVGCEALVRWVDGERMIPPGGFIGIAEETGLIRPLGDWVFAEAGRQASAWAGEGHDLRVAVNLSLTQLTSPTVVDDITRILESCSVDPSLLEIEITESAAMDDVERTIRILEAIRDIGMRLSIDDFGTGYASLSYLHRLPIDKVKIDQSFIRELSSERRESAIVAATIAMARALGLQVTAEGVENRYQYAFLHMARCDFAQGFVISEALPVASFSKFLRKPPQLRNYIA